jgi:uncharacterized protein YjbI with pentapeptide repeats
VVPEAARSATQRVWSGDQVLAQLRKGSFVHRGVTIDGRLDFRPLESVAHAFACRDCNFTGPVFASDTTFERAFDVGGAQLNQPVRMSRAVFEGPAVFGKPPGSRVTLFSQTSDFALARFNGLASFEGANFTGSSRFALARFEGNAIFSGGTFLTSADFARASFGGVADFREAWFYDGATFDEGEFARLADFALAHFFGRGMFSRARFGGTGRFFGAQFKYVAENDFSADFQQATGDMDFSSAQVGGGVTFRRASAGMLSFDRAKFFAPRQAVFTDASSPNFVMDVGTVDEAVQPFDRIRVLQMVEASAKARNDLSIANDAHYDLASLRSDGYWWPWRMLDRGLYGGIAGYFVRPFRPMVALLVLAAILALVRTVRTRSASTQPRKSAPWRSTIAKAGTWLHRFTTELLDGLARIGRGVGADPPSLGRRLETFTYRVLIVCALLGFANSNPTLRQMLDALR